MTRQAYFSCFFMRNAASSIFAIGALVLCLCLIRVSTWLFFDDFAYETRIPQTLKHLDLILTADTCPSRPSEVTGKQIEAIIESQIYPKRADCPDKKLQDSKFQDVDGLGIFVYSAYLDDRVPGEDRWLVRIYLTKPIQTRSRLFCHLMDPITGASLAIQEATKLSGYGQGLHRITEYRVFKYGSYVMTCPFDKKMISNVCEIFVSSSDKVSTRAELIERNSPVLPVRTTHELAKKRSSALCIRNLHNSDTNIAINLLAESLEYTFESGVELIVFYFSGNLSSPLKHLFTLLNREGRDIRLVPWNLPEPDQVYSFNQPLLTNDCLMRLAGEARYVHFHDFDEIFVPAPRFKSFKEASEKYFSDYNNFSTMCLLNRFYPSTQYEEQARPVLRIAQGRHRCEYNDAVQTKCLVDPRQVLEMNVHAAWLSITNHFIWSWHANPDWYGKMHHMRSAPWHYCGDNNLADLTLDDGHLKALPSDWSERIYNRLKVLLNLCGVNGSRINFKDL